MSRQEFLQRLRDTLTGEVPGNVIEENIRYYDEYIRTEAAKGQTEDEVTGAIGDPRLIAKTIMEATENAREGGRQSAYDTYRDESRNAYEEEAGPAPHLHFIDLSKWYWKLLAVVAVVLFFFLVASIVTGIFSILIPLIGPLLLIFLVIKLIKGPRR